MKTFSHPVSEMSHKPATFMTRKRPLTQQFSTLAEHWSHPGILKTLLAGSHPGDLQGPLESHVLFYGMASTSDFKD